MTEPFIPDELVEDGERYVFRGGNWTNAKGMRVSITISQAMTMKFYEIHGRAPRIDPKPKPARVTKAAERAKTSAVRAAVAKAMAKQSAKQSEE